MHFCFLSLVYLVLAQEPVVFWRVLRRKLGSSAGGDSLRFLVDFLKPKIENSDYNFWTGPQQWHQILSFKNIFYRR